MVFSGLFTNAVKDDDELAALLAHELGHILADHDRERMSLHLPIGILIALPLYCINYLAEKIGLGLPVALLSLISFAPLASVTTYSSRRQEKEADYIAMNLMKDAGFDPSATVSLFKKIQYLQDRALSASSNVEQIPQWLSTHPAVS